MKVWGPWTQTKSTTACSITDIISTKHKLILNQTFSSSFWLLRQTAKISSTEKCKFRLKYFPHTCIFIQYILIKKNLKIKPSQVNYIPCATCNIIPKKALQKNVLYFKFHLMNDIFPDTIYHTELFSLFRRCCSVQLVGNLIKPRQN